MSASSCSLSSLDAQKQRGRGYGPKDERALKNGTANGAKHVKPKPDNIVISEDYWKAVLKDGVVEFGESCGIDDYEQVTAKALEYGREHLGETSISDAITHNISLARQKKRDTTGWKQLAQSQHSANTVNPIRKIADGLAVQPNPEKSPIKLNLGDPTLFGNLPPPEAAIKALQDTIASHRYDGYGPAVGDLKARQAVADYASRPGSAVTPDDVILASGCSHALQMAIEAIADPGDNILVPSPGFPLYKTLCRPHGIEDRAYRLDLHDGGQVDLFHLEQLIDERTKAIIINNPCNPTGIVFSKEHLEAILRIAERHRVVLIADEIYGDLVYSGAVFHPMHSLSPRVPVITCDGLAKRWLVPGWRLGWVIVHDRHGVLSEVRKGMIALSQKIVGPCALLQGALPAILRDTPAEYFERTRRVIAANAQLVQRQLSGVLGVRCLRPHGAMYMMLTVDEKLYGDDMQFCQNLIMAESVYCLPGTAFDAPGWIRLVITHPQEQIVEACARIRAFCAAQRRRGNAEPRQGSIGFDENLDEDEDDVVSEDGEMSPDEGCEDVDVSTSDFSADSRRQ